MAMTTEFASPVPRDLWWFPRPEQAVFGVTRCLRMQLAEAFELVHRQVVAGSGGGARTANIEPWPFESTKRSRFAHFGLAGLCRRCRPHSASAISAIPWHSRVTGICRLHGVHGQRTNRVGQVLAHVLENSGGGLRPYKLSVNLALWREKIPLGNSSKQNWRLSALA